MNKNNPMLTDGELTEDFMCFLTIGSKALSPLLRRVLRKTDASCYAYQGQWQLSGRCNQNSTAVSFVGTNILGNSTVFFPKF